MNQVPILLLKEGTETAQGNKHIVSNIQACQAVADSVRTTLGPRGMDKLITDNSGKATISNDGATILKLLDIVFPAAKTLVDIAKSQDAEVGDGTTTVTILAAEFLKNARPFIEDGVHPQVVIRAYRKAADMAVKLVEEIAVQLSSKEGQEKYDLLLRCAETALSSKLVATQKASLAKIVVDAVLQLGKDLPMENIGIKKVHGGSLDDTRLIPGIAFKKCFSYAGFEMQQKKYLQPKIALLNVELELKAEKENAECRIESVAEYQKIVDAEWQILYDKLQKIQDSGANVVLSKLPIGDVATQWFADRDMFCAGRVLEEDLKRTMQGCGGSIQTSVSKLTSDVLGTCERFEEEQIGNERYNLFYGCSKGNTCTIILRGGAEQFIDETERSLHDAIMIVRRAMKNDAVVAGGGAIEMEISRDLRDKAKSIGGKEQLLVAAFARSFEVIPQQLCHNAGFDATDMLNKLRQKHAQGHRWIGIDVVNEDLADNMEAYVWEPSLVKINAIRAAAEAACLILSIDETVKNPKSNPAGGFGG